MRQSQIQPRPGRIVILNGAPRAGKSSLVRAVQHQVPGVWLNPGVAVLITPSVP